MLNFLQSLFLPCLNKIKVLHLRNRINLNKMKMKIAFRYYSFCQHSFTDKIFIIERHYYKIVTRFSKSKKTERLPEIKNNTFFRVKKMK
jgi:hypothetical protein